MEALQRLHNRGSISTGYDIDNSVKLEDANSEWLYRASPTAGNRRTYTFSFWIKRTELGAVNASGNQFMIGQGQHGRMYFGSEYFQYRFDDGHDCRNVSRQFRDTSAWYHFVVAVDTNQSSSSNRVKLYVNGESLAVDDHDGGSFPDIQDQGAFFSTSYLTIGTAPFGGSYNAGDGAYDMSGYLSEFCAVDGQQLTPTDFGEFDSDSGIWKPIDVSGINFGSQGFYLNFDDSSDLGADSSGNGNDFTKNNISAVDQATDTPTNNFCTLNPLFVGNQSTRPSDGATYMSDNGTNQDVSYAGTMGVTKGKWYYETYIDMRSTSYGLTIYVGYHTFKDNYRANAYWSSTNQDSVALYGMHTGQYWTWNGGSRSVTSGLGSIGTSGVGKYVGIALNLDDNQITFYYDGSAITNGSNLALNNLGTDTDAGIFAIPAISVYDNNHTVNFGGYTKAPISSAQSDENGYGTFEHAPPSGYYALCTKNLEEFG